MASARWFSGAALSLVMIGAAAGVAARAAITLPPGPAAHPLVVPALTMGINLLGSFLLGVVVGWLDDRHPRWRLFLGTGVMGGFTTYSAFSVSSVTTSTAAPLVGLALILVSVFGGAVLAAAGLGAGRRLVDAPGEIEPPEEAR